MLYAIVGEDIPNSLQKRTAARPAHLKRVDELIAAGKLSSVAHSPPSTASTPGLPA